MPDVQANAPTLLVVEDEALVRLVLVENLEELGFRVESVGLAREALERLLKGQFDAIILDVGLPDRRGSELATEIRSQHAELPIVITTGYDADILRDRFKSDRLTAIIAKPFDISDAVAILVFLGVPKPAERH